MNSISELVFMLNSILKVFSRNISLQALEESLAHNRRAVIHGMGGSSASFLAVYLAGKIFAEPDRSILAVLPDEEEAESFRDDVEGIIGASGVRYFPERDTSPYEHADSHVEVRSQRVETLDSLERGWRGVVIAAAG
ncbi:MAG: hypothetical protein WCU00_03145, partial [Candidatus Latescibacterota bacterium]